MSGKRTLREDRMRQVRRGANARSDDGDDARTRSHFLVRVRRAATPVILLIYDAMCAGGRFGRMRKS